MIRLRHFIPTALLLNLLMVCGIVLSLTAFALAQDREGRRNEARADINERRKAAREDWREREKAYLEDRKERRKARLEAQK
jgi:hypothetical protein